ncbi:hypothetical protein BDR06DRAFT_974658 [Suillus hirtellus]|nr:hypothetical protein BDR06DRAFT_974658 [Suillus hirtellus]
MPVMLPAGVWHQLKFARMCYHKCSTKQSMMMRLGFAGSYLFNWFIIILLSSGFLLMVLCGALGCSWERAMDTCGLSRHCTSCHFYKRSSILATQKRQERAKEAVSANLAANLPQSMFLHRIGHPKPIAPCSPLLAEKMLGPVAAVLDTSGLTDLQHSVLPGHTHDDTDCVMDVDHGTSWMPLCFDSKLGHPASSSKDPTCCTPVVPHLSPISLPSPLPLHEYDGEGTTIQMNLAAIQP